MRFGPRIRSKLIKKLSCLKSTLFLRISIILFCGWILFYIRKIAILCDAKNSMDQQPIDVVYTWVNGSDPEFIQQVHLYDSNYDRSRFSDKNELKYSLRSLVKYAPWIRNVYILTNGQIPNWLDLENPKVTVISHMDLCNDRDVLPTFSSATIETFLHLIPNLSERFLYMNDDIFLGQPLYIEDLYTYSDGVKIYTAWSVPNCAPDCPWAYIGDGMCDEECNRIECKFDEGDCDNKIETMSQQHNQIGLPIAQVDNMKTFIEIPKIEMASSSNTIEAVEFIKIIGNRTNKHIKEAVNVFNENQKERLKLMERKRKKYATKIQKEPADDGGNTINNNGVSSKDMFAKSLIYTNYVINKMYGFKARKVIAHVGLLMEKSIIEEMLQIYYKEFQLTRSHRLRHSHDMQFSFSYYHHLMLQTKNLTLEEIFDEFDTDKSGSWSDREIRTLLTRIYPLPLRWDGVRFFEDVVVNCSSQDSKNMLTIGPSPTLLYERYEDSNIPRVLKNLIVNCAELEYVLRNNFGSKPKYQFTINAKTWMHSNFKMLTSNLPQVVDALDELRRSPKKFNCINDNMNFHSATQSDENQLIIGLLEDFYLSLFPERSHFELPDDLRNRFTNIFQYRKWIEKKQKISYFVYSLCAIILLFVFRIICIRQRSSRICTKAYI